MNTIIHPLWAISQRFMHSLPEELSKIRNIALLAHIDAGKTTTTERMLYYSGMISRMGEVHLGNTVTDFLGIERSRGITVASAFVTFPWKGYTCNLVDTPGHIDFTMEVEQSIKVIDSAIIILDASAGVEAQTLTVWHQLVRKNLPVIFYVNKMDRNNANLNLCLTSLKSKLQIEPLQIHLPIKDEGNLSLINVVSMEQAKWSTNSKNYTKKPICESNDLYFEALTKKADLVDRLSTKDDHLANTILECGSLELVNKDDIIAAIRRVTIARTAVPVVCGSSYKNKGVECLLDAIIDFLPSPIEAQEAYFNEIGVNNLIARCFKITHDKQRGPLTFCRVYSGTLQKGQKVYNSSQNNIDQVGRILRVFGDDFQEVSSAKCGNFIAVTGLKDVVSGDLICSSANTAKHLKNKLTLTLNKSEHLINQSIIGNSTYIPDPVFFCSVEPPSQRWQPELDKALSELQREDPSLRVNFDSETGQTILAGMGELHLEVVKEKLSSHYGISVDMGPMHIVYKEELLTPLTETFVLKNFTGSREQTVSVIITLDKGERKDILILDSSKESAQNLAQTTPRQVSAIKSGIISALSQGPLFSSQVVNVHAVLHQLEAKKTVPEQLITAAASHCVTKILQKSGTQLLEPFMTLHIAVNEEYLKPVLNDLSRRRAIILNIEHKLNTKEIYCEAPLVELLGYAKYLRTLTSGTANFNMEYSKHQIMNSRDQSDLINNDFRQKHL